VLMRRTRARNFRFARGSTSAPTPTGISSEILEFRQRYLRIARSTPPALISTIVPNSRNCFRCWPIPRTKTGIAMESLGHRRRSLMFLPETGTLHLGRSRVGRWAFLLGKAFLLHRMTWRYGSQQFARLALAKYCARITVDFQDPVLRRLCTWNVEVAALWITCA